MRPVYEAGLYAKLLQKLFFPPLPGAFWVELTPEVQDEIISGSEHKI